MSHLSSLSHSCDTQNEEIELVRRNDKEIEIRDIRNHKVEIRCIENYSLVNEDRDDEEQRNCSSCDLYLASEQRELGQSDTAISSRSKFQLVSDVLVRMVTFSSVAINAGQEIEMTEFSSVKDNDKNTEHTHFVNLPRVTSLGGLQQRLPISELVGGVLLIGLWDCQLNQIKRIGSGFFIDASKGFVATAAHIFNDHVGEKVGKRYTGLKQGKAVIGIIPKENHSNQRALFMYGAEIVAQNPSVIDACILRVTMKFKEPMQCNGSSFKEYQTIIPMNVKEEKIQQFKLAKGKDDERVIVIGFDQSGFETEKRVNQLVSLKMGYVTKPMTENQETIINCSSVFCGYSGGPCLNLEGNVIGLVSRIESEESTKCYLASSVQLEKLLKKAKKICARSRT